MEIDRETIIESVAATIPVAVMIAVLMYIGTSFTDASGILTPTGGQAMVGAIVFFVAFMFAIGVYLSRIRPDGDGNANGA